MADPLFINPKSCLAPLSGTKYDKDTNNWWNTSKWRHISNGTPCKQRARQTNTPYISNLLSNPPKKTTRTMMMKRRRGWRNITIPGTCSSFYDVISTDQLLRHRWLLSAEDPPLCILSALHSSRCKAWIFKNRWWARRGLWLPKPLPSMLSPNPNGPFQPWAAAICWFSPGTGRTGCNLTQSS